MTAKLNVITDVWIPCLYKDGEIRQCSVIDALTNPEIIAPQWGRADFNLATYELLCGIMFMCMAPKDQAAWEMLYEMDAASLRVNLTTLLQQFVPYFNLLGDGPRFLQSKLANDCKMKSVEMLFIDSAGDNTVKKNKDIMVHRDRYTSLDLPFAAMALYTLQAYAPAGGAGNRTSMRGGGPMITIMNPKTTLRDMVIANLPYGMSCTPMDLPWMKPVKDPNDPASSNVIYVDMFFGQPRTLFLVDDGSAIIGVKQKPHGNNYTSSKWEHPSTPYYRETKNNELLPIHPKPGMFSFRSWNGTIFSDQNNQGSLANVVKLWKTRGFADATILIGGYAMDNMTPVDFIWSEHPFIDLSAQSECWLADMIDAANIVRSALYVSVMDHVQGVEREAIIDTFFAETEGKLNEHIQTLKSGGDPRNDWKDDLMKQALRQFDDLFMETLSYRTVTEIEHIARSRTNLQFIGNGYGKFGKSLFTKLGMQLPPTTKKTNGVTP